MGSPASVEWDDVKVTQEVPTESETALSVGVEFLAAGDGDASTPSAAGVSGAFVKPNLKL